MFQTQTLLFAGVSLVFVFANKPNDGLGMEDTLNSESIMRGSRKFGNHFIPLPGIPTRSPSPAASCPKALVNFPCVCPSANGPTVCNVNQYCLNSSTTITPCVMPGMCTPYVVPESACRCGNLNPVCDSNEYCGEDSCISLKDCSRVFPGSVPCRCGDGTGTDTTCKFDEFCDTTMPARPVCRSQSLLQFCFGINPPSTCKCGDDNNYNVCSLGQSCDANNDNKLCFPQLCLQNALVKEGECLCNPAVGAQNRVCVMGQRCVGTICVTPTRSG